eukprot:15842-Pleurochrysis_carterae.AAC.2
MCVGACGRVWAHACGCVGRFRFSSARRSARVFACACAHARACACARARARAYGVANVNERLDRRNAREVSMKLRDQLRLPLDQRCLPHARTTSTRAPKVA